MRLVPALLVNAVVAAAAILVYDTVRGPGPEPAGPAAPGAAPDLSARLAALEARIDGLGAARADRSVATRLAALEERVEAALPSAAGPAAGAKAGTSDGDASVAAPGSAGESAAADPARPVSDAEVARFRKVQERADAERERERITTALDAIVARLGLQLTPEQRTRLAAETVSYRTRLREVFPGPGPGGPGGMGGMGGGRPSEEAFAAVQEAQRGYVAKLEEFLVPSDAAAIASAITPGPRGPGRGAPGDGQPPSR